MRSRLEVSALAINCVFQADCKIPVSDSSGNILLPTLNAGDAWLQSRTFAGEASAPAGAATAAPMQVIAQVAVTGNVPIYGVDARVPTHAVPKDPPGGL